MASIMTGSNNDSTKDSSNMVLSEKSESKNVPVSAKGKTKKKKSKSNKRMTHYQSADDEPDIEQPDIPTNKGEENKTEKEDEKDTQIISNGGANARTEDMDELLEEEKKGVQLSATLSPTIYSIIYVCSVRSKAFYLALLIFCFQVTFPIVVLLDLIDSSASDVNNVFSIPAGINIETKIAGFLSLVLAVPYFADTLDAIEKLQEGYDPVVTKQSPHATRWKWLLGGILQLSIGLLFNFAIFVLVIQSSDVIGMFLNFAALAFITEIDELFFSLASRGFFTRDIQASAVSVESFETPNAENFIFKRVFLFCTTCLFLGGYWRITSQQSSGEWLCKRIEVQFGGSLFNQGPYYSGMYYRSEKILDNGRFSYIAEDGEGGAAFRYCNENGASYWVWGVLGSSSLGEITLDNLCHESNWIARSPETQEFDLADITAIPPSSWVILTRLDSEIMYPVDHFVLRCADCSASNCDGTCADNICVCDETSLGSQCTFSKYDVCPVLDKDPITDDFPRDDEFRLQSSYTTLLDRNGDLVLSYGKPVYYYVYELDGRVQFADVLVFMGHRYYAGFVFHWLSSDTTLEEFTLELVDLFSSFHYRRYQDLYQDDEYPLILMFGFASDPFELGQSSDQIFPTNKRWFKINPDENAILTYNVGAIDTGPVLHCDGARCLRDSDSEIESVDDCPTVEGSDENFCRNIQDFKFNWAIFSNSTSASVHTDFCDCESYSIAKYERSKVADGVLAATPYVYYGPGCSAFRTTEDPDELAKFGLRL